MTAAADGCMLRPAVAARSRTSAPGHCGGFWYVTQSAAARCLAGHGIFRQDLSAERVFQPPHSMNEDPARLQSEAPDRGGGRHRPAAFIARGVLDGLPPDHAADVSGGCGPDHRRHRAAGHCLAPGRNRARVLDRGVLPDRQHDRGSGLRPARRHRSAAD